MGYNEKWAQLYYDSHKAVYILRKYGITLEQAHQQLEKQDFKCAVCGCHLDDRIGRNAQIEHDHVTKKFRGIVCLRCNLALGWIKDNPAHVHKLLAYLGEAIT